MRSPTRTRRLIATLAAYLVALQALLLPLTIAAGVDVAQGAPLCQTLAAVESGGTPANRDTGPGCACAAGCGMQCHAPALGVPPQDAVAIDRPFTVATVEAVPANDVVRPVTRGPATARAPPSA